MRSGKHITTTARRLRRELTLPEVQLWIRLRETDGDQPRFRRQHPLGPYVLDFYCPAAKLCIEVDGWGHNMGDQPTRDERRDAWLDARAVETLRIPASEVLADPDEIASSILRTAMERARAPSTSFAGPPPPLRRGGE